MRTVRSIKTEGSLTLGATYNVVRETAAGYFITGNGLHNHGAWSKDFFVPVERKEVVLLSGGLDSATVLWMFKDRKPECVSFDYGQTHIREIESAKKLAYLAGCHHVVIKLPMLVGGALTRSVEMPGINGDPSDTVVPNRNMIFMAVAANYVGEGGEIYFGGHASDHAVYPDCRPEFLNAMATALKLSCGVTLRSPLVSMDRESIARMAEHLGVPTDLTWSCYAGGDEPCRTCPACIGRQKCSL